MKKVTFCALLAAAVALPFGARAEVSELKIPLGAGGFGFTVGGGRIATR